MLNLIQRFLKIRKFIPIRYELSALQLIITFCYIYIYISAVLENTTKPIHLEIRLVAK